MKFFGQQRDPLQLFARRVFTLVVLILVVAAASGVWSVYQKERESRQLRAEAEAEFADLEKRKAQLERDISTLRTTRGKEEALRSRYELAREGEGMIVIVEPPQPKSQEKPTPPLMRWFNRIFHW